MAWDPVHDGRSTFLTCLWAQCAPGRAHGPLPPTGLSPDRGLDGAAAVLLSLLDADLTLGHAGATHAGLVTAICAATGARQGAVADADFVLVDATSVAPGAVPARARRGTPEAPETGATLVYRGGPAATPACVAGPGVDGVDDVTLPLGPSELAALAAANGEPLLGVDAFVVDPGGRLVALPRGLAIDIGPRWRPRPAGV